MRALPMSLLIAFALAGTAAAQELHMATPADLAPPVAEGKLKLTYRTRDPEWWSRGAQRNDRVATPEFWRHDTAVRRTARLSYGLSDDTELFIGADRQGRKLNDAGGSGLAETPLGKRKGYAVGISKRW